MSITYLRRPLFEYVVEVPFKPSEHFDYDDDSGRVFPVEGDDTFENHPWMRFSQSLGGRWDSCLCRRAGTGSYSLTVMVSFENADDAALFRLKFA